MGQNCLMLVVILLTIQSGNAMKLLILLNAFFMLSNDDPTHVKGKGYEGYIFDETHFVMVSVQQQKSRYTPTKDDVAAAEKLLKEKLPSINKGRVNQIRSCPVIDKKLKRYKRQYVGFINDKGEKILWINLIWVKRVTESELSKDIVSVQDGCSYYWNVKINVTTGEVFDLRVNGRG